MGGREGGRAVAAGDDTQDILKSERGLRACQETRSPPSESEGGAR